MFFTGSAGSGKSLLLQYVVALLRSRDGDEGRGIAVTASTGVAAVHVGGVTLHRWAGIGRGDGTRADVVRRVKGSQDGVANWSTTKTLVIDEISLVSAELVTPEPGVQIFFAHVFFFVLQWGLLCYVGGLMRKRVGGGKPFGGIQLVVCGDFHQLPPVGEGSNVPLRAFECPEWTQCFEPPLGASVVLHRIYRQTDSAFLRILSDVRTATLSADALRHLNQTCCRPLSVQDGIEATKVFPLKRDVASLNEERLAGLPAPPKIFTALDRLEVIDDGTNDAERMRALKSRHPLFNSIIMAETVTLKEGAQVMLYVTNALGILIHTHTRL